MFSDSAPTTQNSNATLKQRLSENTEAIKEMSVTVVLRLTK